MGYPWDTWASVKQHLDINVFKGLNKTGTNSLIFQKSRELQHLNKSDTRAAKAQAQGLVIPAPVRGLCLGMNKKKLGMQQTAVHFWAVNAGEGGGN